ncbi:MAG: LIC_10705 family lipoprotein [Leptospiraceae bacterium]|nr:LIC_10705 family lipoprotein [Leptospiraceae bacterium]
MKTENLFIHFILLIFLLVNCNPPRKTWQEKLSQPGGESALLFLVILPSPDFNRFCPPTEQIPVLEPGIHNIYLEEGQSYLFDNRARLDMANITDSLAKEFSFSYQENLGQNVTLRSESCTHEGGTPGIGDSGLSGQIENIIIGLRNPIQKNRFKFFAKLTSSSGSGSVQITTPTTFNP